MNPKKIYLGPNPKRSNLSENIGYNLNRLDSAMKACLPKDLNMKPPGSLCSSLEAFSLHGRGHTNIYAAGNNRFAFFI
jgi:hypothetical protein